MYEQYNLTFLKAPGNPAPVLKAAFAAADAQKPGKPQPSF